MHILLGLVALIGLVAFAFGENTARTLVGTVLLTGALAFAYVMFRVVSGTI